MIASTFQLAPGIGRARERQLWSMGLGSWQDLRLHPRPCVTPAFDKKLRQAVDSAADALARGDAASLASMVPSGERWRLLPDFAQHALFLDIETGDDDVAFAGISAIGMLDRRGPRLLLGGRDLEAFPRVASGHAMLVTFNGLSFDVPVLRKAFPTWAPPPLHVDLRHVLARAGHHGGLKAIEVALGMPRPDHLAGIDGFAAVWLWRRGQLGDRAALRRFAEYNLMDVVNLPALSALAYNALVDAVGAPAVRDATARLAIPWRGDVLYDVSKILLQL
ncbi:MAG: ribonuclease H-like domain-containing protein [Pseudomonadota bacterium]